MLMDSWAQMAVSPSGPSRRRVQRRFPCLRYPALLIRPQTSLCVDLPVPARPGTLESELGSFLHETDARLVRYRARPSGLCHVVPRSGNKVGRPCRDDHSAARHGRPGESIMGGAMPRRLRNLRQRPSGLDDLVGPPSGRHDWRHPPRRFLVLRSPPRVQTHTKWGGTHRALGATPAWTGWAGVRPEAGSVRGHSPAPGPGSQGL